MIGQLGRLTSSDGNCALPYAGMPQGAVGATHPEGAAVAVALTVAYAVAVPLEGSALTHEPLPLIIGINIDYESFRAAIGTHYVLEHLSTTLFPLMVQKLKFFTLTFLGGAVSLPTTTTAPRLPPWLTLPRQSENVMLESWTPEAPAT